MTSKEFVQTIIELYQEARLPKFNNSKISRGRSHTISSSAEDLFAKFLIEADMTIDKILIDQPISMAYEKLTFYPDITIVHDDQITAFLDLKMDLGWMRNRLSELYLKDQLLMKNARGAWCKYRHGVKKEFCVNIKISENAIYDIVILSDQNISKTLLNSQKEKMKSNNNEVQLHILTKNEHLNTYGLDPSALLKKISIDEPAFEELLYRLKYKQ